MKNGNQISKADRNALRSIKVWHTAGSERCVLASPAVKQYAAAAGVMLNDVTRGFKKDSVSKADIDCYLQRQKYFEALQLKYKRQRAEKEKEDNRIFDPGNIFDSVPRDLHGSQRPVIAKSTREPEVRRQSAEIMKEYTENHTVHEDAAEVQSVEMITEEETTGQKTADPIVIDETAQKESVIPMADATPKLTEVRDDPTGSESAEFSGRKTETAHKNQTHINPPRYRHVSTAEERPDAENTIRKNQDWEDPWSTVRRLIVP